MSQQPIDPRWVTTAGEIPGARVVRSLGIVRGNVIRTIGDPQVIIMHASRGHIPGLSDMAEENRQGAYAVMVKHAAELGANGVIAMRYDSVEMAQGVIEVLCY